MVKSSVDFGIPGVNLALWSFPAITLAFGLTYLGPASRLTAPAYMHAAQAGPFSSMHEWGWVFIVVGLLKLGALLTGRIKGYGVAMCLGLGLYATWSVIFLNAVLTDDRVSYAAVLWPAWMCFMHVCALFFLIWVLTHQAAGRS